MSITVLETPVQCQATLPTMLRACYLRRTSLKSRGCRIALEALRKTVPSETTQMPVVYSGCSDQLRLKSLWGWLQRACSGIGERMQ